MKESVSYNLMTLKASKMTMFSSYCVNENNNMSLCFDFNFKNKPYIKNAIVKSVESFQDCALFYQLIKSVEKVKGVSFDSLSEDEKSDFLRRSLVFVDFNDASIKLPDKRNVDFSLKIFNNSLDENEKLSVLLGSFNEENIGFTITFEDGTKTKFVPFEKSASMSRNSRISFIDRELLEEINARIMNGIEITKEIGLSKYYAYRGLYFSSGHRIENKDLLFNEDTVIVIEDKNIKKSSEVVYTAKKDDVKYVFYDEETDLTLNAFDGEGLICPEYASLINTVLKSKYCYGENETAHSFQIRMPFIKGLLHSVDFNGFLSTDNNRNKFFVARNNLALDDMKLENELMITDAFGIKRDIRKARVILTVSMFKCFKWVLNSWGSHDDPMKTYFDHFNNDYDHALYVGNTDVLICGGEKTKLNYQFLNTLAFDDGALLSLVRKQQDELGNVCDSYLNQHTDIFDYDTFEVKDDFLPEGNQDVLHKAVRKNPCLIDDPKVVSAITGAQTGLAMDLGRGQLTVSGEQRFLSRDLFSMLFYIFKLSDTYNNLSEEKKKNIEEYYKSKKLYADRFYLPGNVVPINTKNYYTILRNPHLSRNEECAMRAFVPQDGSIYQHYFSHLKGVVMIGETSLANETLGGADFDGDLVKVITEKAVCDAVLRGCFKADDDGKFSRVLPMIKIPGGSGESSAIPKKYVGYDLIRNSFSNQIGQISNAAIKIGKIEYSEPDNEVYKNRCAQCTIITGLEIDAAKTGEHPTANIEEIKSLASRQKDYFIETKGLIENIAQIRQHIVPEKKEDGDKVVYSINVSGKTVKIIDFSNSEGRNNIDCLPYYFLDYVLSDKKKNISEKGKAAGVKSESAKDVFFTDKNFIFEDSKTETLKDIILAYKGIYKYSSSVFASNKFKIKLLEKNAGAFIVTIKKQYDYDDNILPGFDDITLDAAVDKLFNELMNADTENNDHIISLFNDSLKRMDEEQWHLTESKDREEVLKRIIYYAELSDSSVALLTNFDCRGYKLLSFALNELIEYCYDSASLESVSALADDETKEKNDSLINKNDYYAKMFELYNRMFAEKFGSKEIKHRLVKLTRTFIENEFESFDEAMTYAIKLRRKYDRSGTFFWDIFTDEEIISRIYSKSDISREER